MSTNAYTCKLCKLYQPLYDSWTRAPFLRHRNVDCLELHPGPRGLARATQLSGHCNLAVWISWWKLTYTFEAPEDLVFQLAFEVGSTCGPCFQKHLSKPIHRLKPNLQNWIAASNGNGSKKYSCAIKDSSGIHFGTSGTLAADPGRLYILFHLFRQFQMTEDTVYSISIFNAQRNHGLCCYCIKQRYRRHCIAFPWILKWS